MERELLNLEHVASWKGDPLWRFIALCRLGVAAGGCCGYHGTSLEAVHEMLLTGFLPCSDDGFLYYMPLPGYLQGYLPGDLQGDSQGEDRSDLECLLPSTDIEALSTAEAYARIADGRSYFVHKLKLSPVDPQSWKAADVLVWDEYALDEYRRNVTDFVGTLQVLRDRDLRADTLEETILAAREHCGGVVIALHERIFQEFLVERAQNDEGYRIKVGRGLPIDSVVGIKLLGRRELLFLKRVASSRLSARGQLKTLKIIVSALNSERLAYFSGII